MNNPHEIPFASEEELLEGFDAFLAQYGEQIEAEDARTQLLNPACFKTMQFSYEILKRLTVSQPDVTITYKLHEPMKSMGYISMEGPEMQFRDIKWFSRVAHLANNTEVTPLTNGNVEVTFTFQNLTVPIKK